MDVAKLIFLRSKFVLFGRQVLHKSLMSSYNVRLLHGRHSIGHNVLRICPVRLSKHHLSIRTNVYIEDNCFLASRKKFPEGATCLRASDDRVRRIGRICCYRYGGSTQVCLGRLHLFYRKFFNHSIASFSFENIFVGRAGLFILK